MKAMETWRESRSGKEFDVALSILHPTEYYTDEERARILTLLGSTFDRSTTDTRQLKQIQEFFRTATIPQLRKALKNAEWNNLIMSNLGENPEEAHSVNYG